MHATFPHRWPAVIAHRGVSSRAIENSFRAFALAVENRWGRCDGIELDIHNTLDGEFVVHHDSALTSGRAIGRLTLTEVRSERLGDGSMVPLLSEVLDATAPLTVYVEVKSLDPRLDDALLERLGNPRYTGRIQVHSFDHRIVARLRSRAPGLVTGVLSASYPVDPVAPALAAGAEVLWQQWDLIDESLMDRARAAGLRVIAWTVNSSDDAKHLAALGVAGLCGNWPERLR